VPAGIDGGRMTKGEALLMLKSAPRSGKPSKVNRSLTEQQSVNIVETYVLSLSAGTVLDDITEKRVYQVSKNQRRPRLSDT
jgi:hypothetical protein